MAKSRKYVSEERVRQAEPESHQNRRETNRHIDDLLKCDIHELEEQWEEFEEIDTFEKIRSPLRKSL